MFNNYNAMHGVKKT